MRYFFDIVTDGVRTRDEEGCDLDSEAEMRKEAVRLLAQIASDEAPFANAPVVSTQVRDRRGRPVYWAELSVEAQRLQ